MLPNHRNNLFTPCAIVHESADVFCIIYRKTIANLMASGKLVRLRNPQKNKNKIQIKSCLSSSSKIVRGLVFLLFSFSDCRNWTGETQRKRLYGVLGSAFELLVPVIRFRGIAKHEDRLGGHRYTLAGRSSRSRSVPVANLVKKPSERFLHTIPRRQSVPGRAASNLGNEVRRSVSLNCLYGPRRKGLRGKKNKLATYWRWE